MFLREVRARLGTKILFVNHGARNHVNGILNWANGMTNGAAGTVLFYDLRERVVSIELDSLVTRVCTSKEAATALKAVLVIDFWN